MIGTDTKEFDPQLVEFLLGRLDALDRDIVPHPFSNWGKGVYLLNLIKICYEVFEKVGMDGITYGK